MSVESLLNSSSPGYVPELTSAIDHAAVARPLSEQAEFLPVDNTVWPAGLTTDSLIPEPGEFPPRFRDCVSTLGVGVTNITGETAIILLEKIITADDGQNRAVYYVNAHTLNQACEDSYYRYLLNEGFRVFGDGTGVRWAARAQGIRMLANLNGTDLVPRLLTETAGKGYTYFMLGADAETIARAANYAREQFPGWQLLGAHHGYVQGDDAWPVIETINRLQPHLLLVGMGNPLQERWIHAHRAELQVRLSMGVGGLFDHWGGNLTRAPKWVRAWGSEWVQILLQQPHKWRRYLLGNPLFLKRVWSALKSDREQTRRWAKDGGLR